MSRKKSRSLDEFERWWREYRYTSAFSIPQWTKQADEFFSDEKEAAKAAWFYAKHKEVKQ